LSMQKQCTDCALCNVHGADYAKTVQCAHHRTVSKGRPCVSQNTFVCR